MENQINFFQNNLPNPLRVENIFPVPVPVQFRTEYINFFYKCANAIFRIDWSFGFEMITLRLVEAHHIRFLIMYAIEIIFVS